MKIRVILFSATVSTAFLCCKHEDNIFPEVKKISEYEATEFLPTLEHPITKNKNSVYAASLLYAWDEVIKLVGEPLIIDKQFNDLILLNNSESHLQTLDKSEYTTTASAEGEKIEVTAEFSKSLPFEIKMNSYNNKLIFDNKKVASFGFKGYEYEMANTASVLYYKDDDNFILKLIPKDQNHEILLFKTTKEFNTMQEFVSELNSKIELGVEEKKKEKLAWKYNINEVDEVIIPKFQFNIECNYSSLEGNNFKVKNLKYVLESVYQRIAFILDESGAEIETEAEIEVAVEITSEEPEEETPHPKKLIFDKPFLLLLKRTNSENPYFGLLTANTELMMAE